MGEQQSGSEAAEHHEVIVIGAGVAGIYALHRLRNLGVDALVLEAGDDFGGTCYAVLAFLAMDTTIVARMAVWRVPQ